MAHEEGRTGPQDLEHVVPRVGADLEAVPSPPQGRDGKREDVEILVVVLAADPQLMVVEAERPVMAVPAVPRPERQAGLEGAFRPRRRRQWDGAGSGRACPHPEALGDLRGAVEPDRDAPAKEGQTVHRRRHEPRSAAVLDVRHQTDGSRLLVGHPAGAPDEVVGRSPQGADVLPQRCRSSAVGSRRTASDGALFRASLATKESCAPSNSVLRRYTNGSYFPPVA